MMPQSNCWHEKILIVTRVRLELNDQANCIAYIKLLILLALGTLITFSISSWILGHISCLKLPPLAIRVSMGLQLKVLKNLLLVDNDETNLDFSLIPKDFNPKDVIYHTHILHSKLEDNHQFVAIIISLSFPTNNMSLTYGDKIMKISLDCLI